MIFKLKDKPESLDIFKMSDDSVLNNKLLQIKIFFIVDCFFK